MTQADALSSSVRPRVSVLILAYNHAAYIAPALQSALQQVTTFPVELLVGEDCSTDDTRDRILEIDRAHPGRLRLIFQPRNIGAGENLTQLLQAARGEYVALLEGDDYWTDPSKLQRQLDALDAHPDWTICFHRAEVIDAAGRPLGYAPAAADFPPVSTFDDLLRSNFISTPTVMFRHGLFPEFPQRFRRLAQQDWPLHLLNARHGSIGYLDRVMSAYRVHAAGAWNRKSLPERYSAIFDACDAVEDVFGEEIRGRIRDVRRRYLVDVCQELDQLRKSTSLRLGTGILRPLQWLRDRCRRRPD